MTYRITPLRPATDDPRDIAERQRIVQNTVVLRDNIEQIFSQCAYWNAYVRTPNQTPIDPDPDGVLRDLLDGFNAVLAAEGITRAM